MFSGPIFLVFEEYATFDSGVDLIVSPLKMDATKF